MAFGATLIAVSAAVTLNSAFAATAAGAMGATAATFGSIRAVAGTVPGAAIVVAAKGVGAALTIGSAIGSVAAIFGGCGPFIVVVTTAWSPRRRLCGITLRI